jgi:hypothetical protein
VPAKTRYKAVGIVACGVLAFVCRNRRGRATSVIWYVVTGLFALLSTATSACKKVTAGSVSRPRDELEALVRDHPLQSSRDRHAAQAHPC